MAFQLLGWISDEIEIDLDDPESINPAAYNEHIKRWKKNAPRREAERQDEAERREAERRETERRGTERRDTATEQEAGRGPQQIPGPSGPSGNAGQLAILILRMGTDYDSKRQVGLTTGGSRPI